jgi:hypothetical protein
MKGGKGKNETFIATDIGVGIVMNFWHRPMVACCAQLWPFSQLSICSFSTSADCPNLRKVEVVLNIGGRLGAGKMLEKSSAIQPKTGTRT